MENKPYKNYAAKPAAPVTPVQSVKVENPIENSVAANAAGVTPSVVDDTKDNRVNKPAIERVDNITNPVKVRIVDVETLNVRSTPELGIPNVVDQLKRDTKVNVSKEIGEFSEIGTNRFVMTKYLI